MVADSNERKFVCTQCGKSLSTKAILKEHVLRHQGVTFPCTLCNQTFTGEANLRRHVKYQHTYTALEPCSICKKEVKPPGMAQHLKLHETDRELYPCQQCGAKLVSKASLQAHILRVHSDEQKMTTCKVCNIEVKQRCLRRHMLTHNTRTFPCPEVGCDKEFKHKRSIQLHLLTHAQDYKKECPVCHLHVAALKEHMKIHDVNREKFPCPECNKLFNTKAHVRRHMLNHTKEQKTECPICKVMCSNVKNHILYVHERKEKETCMECGKQVKHLNLHMNTMHRATEREKKLCLVCKKEVVDLKTHLKMHDGDREMFACPQCKTLFNTKYHLASHMKTHDKNREMFPCDFCDKLYTRKHQVKKHMMNIHNGQQEKTECPICKKKLVKVQQHILHVHNKIKSKCPICEKEISTSGLKKHMKTHDRDRETFSCPECEKKTFTSKGHVKRHMLIHSRALQKTQWLVEWLS